jgi:prophage regulatory protein
MTSNMSADALDVAKSDFSNDRLLRTHAVIKMLSISRAKLYRSMKDDGFPRPVKLGDGDRSGSIWLKSEVDAWIARRIHKRDAANSTKASGEESSRENYLGGKPP